MLFEDWYIQNKSKLYEYRLAVEYNCGKKAAWEIYNSLQQWSPIETAPKEGEFLVCGGICVPDFGKEWENVIAHVEIEDNDSGYFICNVACYPVEVVNPTHWMPLPELPKNEVII